MNERVPVPQYRVGARDVLDIQFVREEELSDKFQVNEDGGVVLPYVGSVPVAGLTTQQVADAVADAYRGDYLVNPQVTVSIAQFMSMPVEVYGAVEKQGTYHLQKPTTVLEILAEAGGVDAQKSNRQVVVRRHNGEDLRINFDKLRAYGEGNIFLHAGDTVMVEEGLFVFVAGHVTKPGAITYLDGLTVLDALIKAGGPSATARLRGAYVLRDGSQIPVNVKKIQDGKDPDLALQPGDKLYLKESPI